MKPTKLIYLEHMQQLTCDAQVEAIEPENEKTAVYLDQTVFYPQGGGQPFDTGMITSSTATFIVDEVRYIEGAVAHKGHFQHGTFTPHEMVHCIVDSIRRSLNARLHSAGHVVDMAVESLPLSWEPTKAYHFPDSPYVEYTGNLDTMNVDELQNTIQQLCNSYIEQNLPVSCRFVSLTELKQLCKHVPANFANLAPEKPIRIVLIDTFAVPCGGTHIRSLQELGSMVITKIKKKGDTIRVGYDVVRR